MKKFHILLFSSLLTLHCSLKAQQVIYVDVSNNTGIEDGTLAHPFNTILEGLQLSQDGDSISIVSGNYTEDTLLIEKCVSIAGESPSSTVVEGTFILSSKLDTLPVLISDIWCRNIMHSDSGFTRTPVSIIQCSLQVLYDYTPSIQETGRILVKNCTAADSIHIESASCSARREVIDCETEGGLWVGSLSSSGNIRVSGNQVGGALTVSTVAQSDTVILTDNTVAENLRVISVASGPGHFTGNIIGNGVYIAAVSYEGYVFRNNNIASGDLTGNFTALATSEISYNTFENGGIGITSKSTDLIIHSNIIDIDRSESGIRFNSIAGGLIDHNTITVPYAEPSGLPFEEDTAATCGVYVQSVSFGGMTGNRISGGAYGVYLSAIASHEFNENEIEGSHYGIYLQSVSGDVDSNLIENCVADGVILNYQAEYGDTNSIRLNHNIVRNNGGHGIRTRGNCPMGRLDEPGTGYNVIKDNGGYDLYVETPSGFVDTIWAQNNEWTHSTEEEVGQFDIYDAGDEGGQETDNRAGNGHEGVHQGIGDGDGINARFRGGDQKGCHGTLVGALLAQ